MSQLLTFATANNCSSSIGASETSAAHPVAQGARSIKHSTTRLPTAFAVAPATTVTQAITLSRATDPFHTIYDNAGRLADKDAQNLAFAGNLGDGTTRTYASAISYSSFGGLQEEKFGTATAIYHKQRFNSRGQLWDMRASTVPFATDPANGDRGAIVNYYSNNLVQGGSGADNNGNLLRQESYIPGSSFFQDNFAYDALNRLAFISEKLNGTGNDTFKQAYIYDRWGNRTIDQVNTTANVPKPNFGVATTNNRLTAPAGYTMSYDAAGNLTTDTYTGEGTRTYDAENRMKQAWSNNQWQTYAYDGDGRRIKRIVNGTETWQVYGVGGELIAEYAANAAPTNPQKEYGYRNGELLITAEVSSGSGSNAQPVTWTNAVGVSVSGNNLTKTAAEGWGNAGASSNQSITSGDGYVESTVSETNKYRMFGLSNGDSHQNYNDIDFAFYPAIGASLYIYEGGVSRGAFGTYATGDVLRVAIEGGVVKYRKNGALLYTSSVAPTYPLLVDTAFYSPSSTINNVIISGNLSGGGGGSSAQIRWLVTDQLGTPRMVFDQTGSLANVSRHDYLPFGEELFAGPQGSPGVGGRTTTMGYTSSDNVRQKFTQKERDNETGLDYFGARYYASTQGRFTGVDSVGPDLTNPQTLNQYQYCLNNPLAKIDRNGRYEEDVHRELTTALAYAAGFSMNEATTIGNRNQHVDDDPATSPMQFDINGPGYRARRDYHFTTEARRDKLWNDFEVWGTAASWDVENPAFWNPRGTNQNRARALDSLGVFLHPQQDSFSHAGYEPRLGHLLAGHGPDKTYNNVGKANRMALDTYNRLVQAGSIMKTGSLPVAYRGFIAVQVNGFNAARTMTQKREFLSRIVWYVGLVRRIQEQPITTNAQITTTIAMR